MTTDTLKITFGQADEHDDAARERLQRAEAGERGEAIEQDARFVLNFEDFGEVERLMRTSSLTLLEAIVNEQPESIRQTAEAVDRDYKEVHRNLEELEALGVIEFEEDGASKKPVLRGGARTLDISFSIGHDAVGRHSGASA
ncbi:transcriptional regulator [Halorientalis sp. IM1011]|uniref:HVO_A0114 family putative DNA-binding protein n=1 Tax=Halorientalis sp. IM1011 TaxID=1932360 RepID=UPI00097CC58C|nr:transcriptional regulator [Halorientalis sp. IM1011]AQL42304.1 transcriptional regulator [Halorientalis sp. IM1011]